MSTLAPLTFLASGAVCPLPRPITGSSCVTFVIAIVTGLPSASVTPMTVTVRNLWFGGQSASGSANAVEQSGGRLGGVVSSVTSSTVELGAAGIVATEAPNGGPPRLSRVVTLLAMSAPNSMSIPVTPNGSVYVPTGVMNALPAQSAVSYTNRVVVENSPSSVRMYLPEPGSPASLMMASVSFPPLAAGGISQSARIAPVTRSTLNSLLFVLDPNPPLFLYPAAQMLLSSGSMSSAPTSSWTEPPRPSPNGIDPMGVQAGGGVTLWMRPSPVKLVRRVYQRLPSTGSRAIPRPFVFGVASGMQLLVNVSAPMSYSRMRAPLVAAS